MVKGAKSLPGPGKKTSASKPAGTSAKSASAKANRKRTPKLPPASVLSAALHALPTSGPEGFEGLVERLLTKLTGTRFLVRRAGSQDGRDIDAGTVFVECKRFEESTPFDQRALLTQVSISLATAPRLDMWVLATTRSADGTAVQWLERETNKLGLDFALLSCGNLSSPGDLDYACASQASDVLEYLRAQLVSTAGVREFLGRVTESPGFLSATERIRQTFSQATVGLPTFRKRLNESLRLVLEDEGASRTRLNSPLAARDSTPDVLRSELSRQLSDFASPKRDTSAPRLCVILGDEGNGKSWALAQWVRTWMQASASPPVFWFKSSACKEPGLRDLARLAVNQLQVGDDALMFLKLQRWVGLDSKAPAIVILDGVNERNSAGFWANYLLHLVGETNANVLFILTCRLETWRAELEPLLLLPAVVVNVSEFNEAEFATAMKGQPAETSERLWSLGLVARKPRYLADALAYLRHGGELSTLTVEMLQYHAWKRRFRTRADYPLGLTDFEDVLRHLAARMSERVTAGDLKDLLATNPEVVDGLRELATGGVLRREAGGALSLHRPYLVEGLSLLLVDTMSRAAGAVPELRQEVGVFVHDTQRHPLTAEICAAAAFKALADRDIRDDVAVALTLEFLDCQNALPTSIEGVIGLACKRPAVIDQIAQALWASTGIDSSIERMVLHGLNELARGAKSGSEIVHVLARWASFVHEDGEFTRREGGAAETSSASVNAIAPQLGRVSLTEDGAFLVERVSNQRLIRLGRLALAVASFGDRRVFFPVVLNSLIADAVMVTSRARVSGWVLGSSREPLNDLVAAAVSRVELLGNLPEEGRRRICRVLMEAAAAPELAQKLRKARSEQEVEARKSPLWAAFRTPSREELGTFLAARGEANRSQLEAASKYASDPGFNFPPKFVGKLRQAAAALGAEKRRAVLGHTIEDHTWEHMAPLLCRLAPDIYEERALDFVRNVLGRSDGAVYPWLFTTDGYLSLLGLPEVDAIAQVWERFLSKKVKRGDQKTTAEFTLFGMLLPFMSPKEQVEQLARRGPKRSDLAAYEHEFVDLPSEAAQADFAALAANDKHLLHVLWYATSLERPVSKVWLPLVDRALKSKNSVTRAFALELLSEMEPKDIGIRLLKYRAKIGERTHLEKYWATRLLLEQSALPVAEVFDQCDLQMCAQVLGSIKPEARRKRLAVGFAGHVLAWLSKQLNPSEPPTPELKVTVRSPRGEEQGLPLASVDWSQVDNSVNIRSEMFTWGGLEPGDSADFSKALSNDNHSELQDALEHAMKSAEAQGNWAYTAFWSDATLNLLFDQVPAFLGNVRTTIEAAMSQRRLRAISSFVASVARALLQRGDRLGLELLELLVHQDVSVRQVDGRSGDDMLDVAVFKYPKPEEAQSAWLEKIDASTSDAYILGCCELLVQGGNAAWLRSQAALDIAHPAPYHRRRGLMLLAGSGCSQADLTAARKALGNGGVGLEDVFKVASEYVERLSWMRHWTAKMMLANEAVDAQCFAMLLLHCADNRVWSVLEAAFRERKKLRSGAAVRHLLPRSDIQSAVKANLKQRNNGLLGYRKADNDAAPWIASEATSTIRLNC